MAAPTPVSDRAEDLVAIQHLRALHEDLVSAVLAAYGWSDIAVPSFCPATDAERAAVSLFEDTVLDRLFALNAEPAAEETRAGGRAAPAATKSGSAKPPRKPRASKSQTSMLDDD